FAESTPTSSSGEVNRRLLEHPSNSLPLSSHKWYTYIRTCVPNHQLEGGAYMSVDTIVYRTYQIRIKKGHRLYPYLDESCRNAKNLYNTTNFYIRQLFTALKQHEPLQPLQQQVLHTIDAHLNAMNVCLRKENRTHPFTL